MNNNGAGTFVSIRGGTAVKIVNNIFSGGGSVPSGAGVTNNLVSNAPGLIDIVNFDYRQPPPQPRATPAAIRVARRVSAWCRQASTSIL